MSSDLLTVILLALAFSSSVLGVLQQRAAREHRESAAKHLALAQEVLALATGFVQMLGKAGPEPSSALQAHLSAQTPAPTTPQVSPGPTQESSSSDTRTPTSSPVDPDRHPLSDHPGKDV